MGRSKSRKRVQKNTVERRMQEPLRESPDLKGARRGAKVDGLRNLPRLLQAQKKTVILLKRLYHRPL